MHWEDTLFDRITIFPLLCLRCEMSLRELNRENLTLRDWRAEYNASREIFFPKRLSISPANFQEGRSRWKVRETPLWFGEEPCLNRDCFSQKTSSFVITLLFVKRREAIILIFVAADCVSIFRVSWPKKTTLSFITLFEQLKRGPGTWKLKKITNGMISHCQKLPFVWESFLCKTPIVYALKSASPQWRHVRLFVCLVSIDNFVAPWHT